MTNSYPFRSPSKWHANTTALIGRRPVTRVCLDLGISQTVDAEGTCKHKLSIARMQNKLCDVKKCLTTVAAGVLSGIDRKKLESGLLFEVLLLDQQITFGVRLFFVTRCSCVPLVTCQKARTRKKLCKWGIFLSEDVQLVKRHLCGVGGMQKRQYRVRGTVFSPVPSERRTVQGMDCEDFGGKITPPPPGPLRQNTCVCGAHFDGGNVKILLRSCNICVD